MSFSMEGVEDELVKGPQSYASNTNEDQGAVLEKSNVQSGNKGQNQKIRASQHKESPFSLVNYLEGNGFLGAGSILGSCFRSLITTACLTVKLSVSQLAISNSSTTPVFFIGPISASYQPNQNMCPKHNKPQNKTPTTVLGQNPVTVRTWLLRFHQRLDSKVTKGKTLYATVGMGASYWGPKQLPQQLSPAGQRP